MKSDLIRSRPGAFEIQPASAAAAIPVADGIWMSPGLSNSYLVVTPEGRVVINTGMGFESGHHQRLYDAVDDGPVRYILLTQGHVDHVGGVDTFREPGTLLVAQANNPTCQADDERIHRFRVRRSQPYWAPAIAAADAFIKAQPEGRADPRAVDADARRAVRRPLRRSSSAARASSCISTPGGETIDSTVDLAPRPRHRVRRQRVQRAVRPLPQPGDAARRPAAVPAAVRRRGADASSTSSPRCSAPATSTRSRARTRSAPSSPACATRCST